MICSCPITIEGFNDRHHAAFLRRGMADQAARALKDRRNPSDGPRRTTTRTLRGWVMCRERHVREVMAHAAACEGCDVKAVFSLFVQAAMVQQGPDFSVERPFGARTLDPLDIGISQTMWRSLKAAARRHGLAGHLPRLEKFVRN